MAKDRETLVNFYLAYDKKINNQLMSMLYEKRYDYDSPKTISLLDGLCGLKLPYVDSYIERSVDKPFLDYFGIVIDKFQSEEVYDHFENVYLNTEFKPIEGLDYDESRAVLTLNENGSIIPMILLPDDDPSALLYAALMHEYGHLFIFTYNGKRPVDSYEYSEVPSIFLEYLMYHSISRREGLNDFTNNRIISLNDSIGDLKEDLYYAKNPHFLMLPSDIYSSCLSASLCIPESVEYVLNLIEREKELKGCSFESMGRVLLGQSTCEEEAKKLDIDTSKFVKVKSLAKKM